MSGLEAPKKSTGRAMTPAHARQLEAARQVKEEKRKLKLAQQAMAEMELAAEEATGKKPAARKRRSKPEVEKLDEAAPEVDVQPEPMPPSPEDCGVIWV